MKKRVFSFLTILLLVFSPICVLAEDYSNAYTIANQKPSSIYASSDYVIDKYDINAVVNDDNSFVITETITAYFNAPRHGIYRKIPLRNEIVRLDGSKSHNRAIISGIEVSEGYTTSYSGNEMEIKIGSENTTITGEHTYVIKYIYDLGKDHVKKFDELYFNLIGPNWDTYIGNVTFTIKMPKDFDSSKLGFSHGQVGSVNSSLVSYNIDDNVITGSYKGILSKNEALTVRCELPEGYFANASDRTSPYWPFMIAVPLCGLLISFLLWLKYGRDDQVIETVEFYPPQGLNSLEVGMLYRGKAVNSDVVSLMVYLANQGYISISETEEKRKFSKAKKGFKITKIKDYDGNNDNERIFLDGLFSAGVSTNYSEVYTEINDAKKNGEKLGYLEAMNRVVNRKSLGVTEVTDDDLKNSFYVTVGEILNNINKERSKIFENNYSLKKVIVFISIFISLSFMIAIPVSIYLSLGDVFHELLIVFFLIPFFAIGVFLDSIYGSARVMWLILCFFFLIIFLASGTAIGVIFDSMLYLLLFVLGIICIVGMCVFMQLMPKRNQYGIQMLGKLRGFKNFLETAEKEQLESMVNQNPTYFYNILPYTYVLGVSDKWIKKFEGIAMQPPSWYDGADEFDYATFSSFMHNTMNSANESMSSSPSDSSGGGSSGGGSGGGGGGSW